MGFLLGGWLFHSRGSRRERWLGLRGSMGLAVPFPSSVTFGRLLNLSVSLAVKIGMLICSA